MSDAASTTDHLDPAHRAPATTEVEAYYREIAPFYDAELADRDDLGFWRGIAAEMPDRRILELGAGSGAVTAVLAARAGLVVGIDISDELLQLARRRLARWPHVHLMRADMRSLPFAPGAPSGQPPDEPFDLIVAANDPLSHLTEDADRDRVLEAAALMLVPGGQLILDALWLPPADAIAVRADHGRLQQHHAMVHGQPLQVVERWRRDPVHAKRCHARYEYRRPGRRPVVATFEARDWQPDELADRFARAGLMVSAWWGSYDRQPWHPRMSQKLIVAARRVV